MATSNALLACFLIIASFCLPTAKSDYNILTLMWPGAACSRPVWFCCRPTAYEQPKLDFFVQTLQSYDTTTGRPLTNCASTCTFYVNQLRDSIEDLNYYWPDVRCPSNNNKAQWESNWCTYGLCSNLTEPIYFRRALDLLKNYDPLFILREFDIVPSDTKTYRPEDIENALLPSLGFSFYIECSIHWRRFFDTQLNKIHICVSADAQRLISCPFRTGAKNCNPQVYFVPFTDNMLHGVGVNNTIKMPSTAGEAAMLM